MEGCKTVTVQAGQSCIDVAAAARITLEEFLSFNSEVDPACSNLLAGTNACISSPMGSGMEAMASTGTVEGTGC